MRVTVYKVIQRKKEESVIMLASKILTTIDCQGCNAKPVAVYRLVTQTMETRQILLSACAGRAGAFALGALAALGGSFGVHFEMWNVWFGVCWKDCVRRMMVLVLSVGLSRPDVPK